MNPHGVNLTDIWMDIPPVRHKKFKLAERKNNQLSTKILERIIHLSTNIGDLILDPFGGGGTTYVVCEALNRTWLGIELSSLDPIRQRLSANTPLHKNNDYIEPT